MLTAAGMLAGLATFATLPLATGGKRLLKGTLLSVQAFERSSLDSSSDGLGLRRLGWRYGPWW